jgi:hypothetical protein
VWALRKQKTPLFTRGEAEFLKKQCPTKAGHSCVARTELVQTDATTLLALHFLGVTLNSGSGLALTLGSRLFVEFAAANFSQYTGFFAGALETTQGYVEGFVLFNFDGWHPGRTYL